MYLFCFEFDNSFLFHYFSFRNAHGQRGIIMILRESQKYSELFVHNPKTKKMECVLSYPKGH